ncbi:MAG: GNAT family N-acetyltransferase [Phenylobacterium sp.]|uniref:GNAT family N-acetyltransferase n=1 Tax=Phenylobacterium sp. TaxID=1871053 RepID=UPI003919DA11
MAAAITIRSFEPQDMAAVVRLILSIQRDEYGLEITAQDQPDLMAVPEFYQTGAGGFWVAERAGAIVGVVGLKDIGGRMGALRKMFVDPSARGPAGAGGRLLDVLLAHARAMGLCVLYLGTTDRFTAAHRFYEKNGFSEVAPSTLPAAFPRMAVDTRFFRLGLEAA